MTKSTTPAGKVMFQCRCLITVEGQPNDTLMDEETFEAAESDTVHGVLVDMAPFDAAGHIVMKDCPNCRLNYMTMFIVGKDLQTMYGCTCGYRASHAEYTQYIIRNETKKVSGTKTSEKK